MSEEQQKQEFTPATAAQELKKLTIDSDGTLAGTTIKVNGKEIKNLYSFNFGAYFDGYSNPINICFSTEDKSAKAGELAQVSYFRLTPLPEPAEANKATASMIVNSETPLMVVAPRNMGRMYSQI